MLEHKCLRIVGLKARASITFFLSFRHLSHLDMVNGPRGTLFLGSGAPGTIWRLRSSIAVVVVPDDKMTAAEFRQKKAELLWQSIGFKIRVSC
jgi:hypothetical protein